MSAIPLGVQLYTLRDEVNADFERTINDIASIGYRGVELAGYGNLKTADKVKQALDKAGLQVIASHVGLDALEKEMPKVLEEQATLGNKRVVCPWVDESRRNSADAWKNFAKTLQTSAEKCQEKGLTFAYHNHSFEFDKFDGKSGFDILWSNASELVKAELDVFWLKHGKEDPAAYINKLGNRVVLLHLKDMAAGPEQKFAPVGSGILDFQPILSAGKKVGVAWNVVEQDSCYDMKPIDSVRKSFEYLKSIGAA